MTDPQPDPAPQTTTPSKLLSPLTSLLRELGLSTLYHSPTDTKILILQRFVRLFAYGGSTLILASYLSDLGNEDQRIGLFMTLTLVGDVFISFLLTLVADQLGRRWILVLGAALMCVSGVVFGLSGNYWVLLAGAILGVISPAYGFFPLLLSSPKRHILGTILLIFCAVAGGQRQRNRTVSCDRGIHHRASHAQRPPQRHLRVVQLDRHRGDGVGVHRLRLVDHFSERQEGFRLGGCVSHYLLHLCGRGGGEVVLGFDVEQGV